MNVYSESFDSPHEKLPGNEPSLPDFMKQNLDHDPEWFREPENTPEYGPPGMPTPLSPMDPLIADRQQRISAALRGILDVQRLPSTIDPNMIDMLQMNFDAYNSILGINNSDSYVNWKDSDEAQNLPASLQAILDKAIPGLATQHEIMDLKVGAPHMQTIESFRVYHSFKIRMRHVQSRREELNRTIVDHGGALVEGVDYYDLRLSPHYSFHEIEGLTNDERVELELLEKSIRQKYKIIFNNEYRSDRTDASSDDYYTPELQDAIHKQIEAEEARKSEISAKSQTNTVVGLIGSIKRRVGVTPLNEAIDVNTTERQLFAIDIREMSDEFQRGLEYVHARKPVDSQSLAIYEQVYDHFTNNSDLIVPVSTTAYNYNVHKGKLKPDSFTRTLARIALKGA